MKSLVYILLVFCALSCKKAEVVEKRFSLAHFKEAIVWSPAHVEIKQDTVAYVLVRGSEEMVEHIEVDLEDTVLHIKDGRGIKWDTPLDNRIDLVISSPVLGLLETKQSCIISARDTIVSDHFGLVLGAKTNEAEMKLDCKVFFYWCGAVTGGRLKLSGKSDVLKIWNAGLMTVDAKEVEVETALVDNKSRGRVELTVKEKLEYSVRGLGDVYLYGNPSIVEQKAVDGSAGTLIRQ